MKFVSTRGGGKPLSFTQAVATGLAPDGGLYVPVALPDIRPHLGAWQDLPYPELCEAFFRLFATDLDADILHACVVDAYARFSHPDIAPLQCLRQGVYVQELFHGPTLAFKDFALQLLGNLYEAQIARTGQPITVLGATSGDTGAAAIHGLLGKQGVHIFILYPRGGVSPLQELQMTCSGADNVYALRVDGTFDDAQAAIKTIFSDLACRAELNLSAVNSINLARILAQCVYYIFAWLRLPEAERDELTFVVPTGNFGNVLAGWWTQRMGLPVRGFRVATNRNDILYRLFTTGVYATGKVTPSVAPSMDIQVASNFERFLHFHEGGDAARVAALMQTFQRTGRLEFADFRRDTFSASRADDADIARCIREVYEESGYILDPHTACGFVDLPADGSKIVLATAHPAKFPDVIEAAIGVRPVSSTLDALREREPVAWDLPAEPNAIRDFIRHTLQGAP